MAIQQYPSKSLRRPSLRARLARSLRFLGAMRGWSRLVNKFVPSHSASFQIRNGRTMFAGDMRSFVDRQLYLFGGYEAQQIKLFLSQIASTRKGTALDIGANIGTHSLAFSRVFKAVHSFEPNPHIWAQFDRNVELNAMRNIDLHRVGLADRDGVLPLLMIDKPNFGLGTFSTVPQYDLPLQTVATCTIRNASSYLSELGVGTVDAIKIDVQGFEPEVLRGLAEILARDKPIIWCEIATGTLTELNTRESLSQLIPYEFRCYKFARSSRLLGLAVKLVECADVLDNADYLIIPREYK